ncbi:MAG: hypothetical protein JO202_01425 [Ktedonobacteraceae bacterium]|nr:hypothetical protein [Ktedonobacteraceae bacterium]
MISLTKLIEKRQGKYLPEKVRATLVATTNDGTSVIAGTGLWHSPAASGNGTHERMIHP